MTTTYYPDSFSTQLSQNGFTLDMKMENCPGGYFKKQAIDLEKGMTFAMSSWGATNINMSWLDG